MNDRFEPKARLTRWVTFNVDRLIRGVPENVLIIKTAIFSIALFAHEGWIIQTTTSSYRRADEDLCTDGLRLYDAESPSLDSPPTRHFLWRRRGVRFFPHSCAELMVLRFPSESTAQRLSRAVVQCPRCAASSCASSSCAPAKRFHG